MHKPEDRIFILKFSRGIDSIAVHFMAEMIMLKKGFHNAGNINGCYLSGGLADLSAGDRDRKRVDNASDFSDRGRIGLCYHCSQGVSG